MTKQEIKQLINQFANTITEFYNSELKKDVADFYTQEMRDLTKDEYFDEIKCIYADIASIESMMLRHASDLFEEK